MARPAPVTSPAHAPAPHPASTTPTADASGLPAAPAAEPSVLDDVLVEEVSIDGMCGVY